MNFKKEKQEEYFKYLKSNKALLITEKQLEVKYTDSITHAPSIARREPKVATEKALVITQMRVLLKKIL